MDGTGTLALLKFLFPQIPLLANAAVWHSLGMTPTASKWDLRTELTVRVLRNMMSGHGGKPSSIGKMQATTLKDPGIKGKMWVAKTVLKAPEPGDEGLREAVFQAIEDVKPQNAGELQYTRPELADLEVEWTGYRPEAGKEEPLPQIPENEKYQRVMRAPTRTSETTILYFHGGAFYLCDPSTHRAICSRLAKESGGKVCSVRYRLAPQAAFPSNNLDALMAYLSLLYPPPGSMHEAVPAEHIVIAGDSAGGNISFALLQLLLQLHRTSEYPTVRFHGKDVPVPLPAGISGNSPWLDICRAMPSVARNAQFDILPPPDHDDTVSVFPHDDIWPAKPPRGDIYCDLSLLDHPLVSPVAAESWRNAPPIWLCTGQEMLTDEDRLVASHAAAEGIRVQFQEYEAMPHCFAMLVPKLPTADKCMRSWGDFCRRCVEEPATLATRGQYVRAKSGKEEDLIVADISKTNLKVALGLMAVAKERRLNGFEKEGKLLPKSTL